MTVESLIPIAYLIAAVTFILGLKGLSSPTTAVQGNRIAAAVLTRDRHVLPPPNQRRWPPRPAGQGVGIPASRAREGDYRCPIWSRSQRRRPRVRALVAILEFAHPRDLARSSSESSGDAAQPLSSAPSRSPAVRLRLEAHGRITPKAFRTRDSIRDRGIAVRNASSVVLLRARNPALAVSPVLIAVSRSGVGGSAVAIVMPSAARYPVVISLLTRYRPRCRRRASP